MTPQEQKTTFSLACIYAFRMLGLFMILPIFSLYAPTLNHATPTLIGIALGIYGLTQATFQIPFAMISDRIGRKPVILMGLLLFIVGSIIAALSNDIIWIIVGRAIQGAGAIGSTLIALVADNTKEENRLKAMAIVGMTIGLSFMIAMVLGSVIQPFIGLSGIFWLTAFLASIAIIILYYGVPTPRYRGIHRDSEPVLGQFTRILANQQLLRLNVGIFSLHAILMALFIVLPLMLVHTTAQLGEAQQWKIYLPTLLVAVVLILPFVMIAEKKRLIKPLYIIAILLLGLTQPLFFIFKSTLLGLSLTLCLFFTAFTFLESCLPSLVSKIAPAGNKGTAMGIYSSAQFLGIFVGASLGGLLYKHFGLIGLFLFCTTMAVVWLVLAITMKNPPYLSSKIIAVSVANDPAAIRALEASFLKKPGVSEVMICPDEQVAYLKIDRKIYVE
ncbi:MAG: MFS transporter [Gammaproteobacteria bacterium]|nr:MFS transporter [Gammaproteobacteria bacterium]